MKQQVRPQAGCGDLRYRNEADSIVFRQMEFGEYPLRAPNNFDLYLFPRYTPQIEVFVRCLCAVLCWNLP